MKTLWHFPVPKGAVRELERALLTRAWSDKTRGNGFKMAEVELD